MRDTSEIDTSTPEGRLLLCAISILCSSCAGGPVTPNEILVELNETSEMVFGDLWSSHIR